MAYENENIQSQGSTSEGNTTNSNIAQNPIPTGSNQEFPLSKTIISNQQAKDILASTFNEVTISEEKFDSEKIKEIYNDLFFLIPKKGKKSHYSIIEQSTDEAFPEINQNLDDSISFLEEEVEELNTIYISGSLPQITSQHPIYDDGILIQNGDPVDNVAIDPSSDIFYMQQGFKRPITHSSRGYYVRLIRQVEGETVYKEDGSLKPLSTSPNFRFLSNDDLNLIPNGEDIDSATSLNLETITDQGPNYAYDEIKLKLTCEGLEKFYKWGYGTEYYDYDLSEYEHGGDMGGYWYLDPGLSCKVFIAYPNLSGGWRTIKGGESLTLKISRDEKFYGHTLNGTTDPLDNAFYQSDNIEVVSRSGYGQVLPSLGTWKRWGEGKRLPGIRDVKPGSRLNYRILSPYNSSGNVVDGGGSHRLSGIIDGEESAVNKGFPKQVNILTSQFDKESIHGTRMINKGCYKPLQGAVECYGDLGQHSTLQNYLNKPDFVYYKTKVTGGDSGIPMYGQPILKINGKFCVFLYGEREGGLFSTKYWNVFMNLHSGTEFSKENKHLDNDVVGYIRDSTKDFDWIINGKPNPTIYYPGLQGVRLNQYLTNYGANNNPFNPKDGGSNYDASLLASVMGID
tara:strand:- start:6525 stop:8396 length:1872 start_codon:yes stop_codon:yes gene_type:complete